MSKNIKLLHSHKSFLSRFYTECPGFDFLPRDWMSWSFLASGTATREILGTSWCMTFIESLAVTQLVSKLHDFKKLEGSLLYLPQALIEHYFKPLENQST
jgi:hypothetical protein